MAKDYYAIAREKGLCGRCRKKKVRKNQKTCGPCKEILKGDIAAKRSARRNSGLCADCGLPSPDHFRCSGCRWVIREKKKDGKNTRG